MNRREFIMATAAAPVVALVPREKVLFITLFELEVNNRHPAYVMARLKKGGFSLDRNIKVTPVLDALVLEFRQ